MIRTVIVASLFFCATLCISLFPVLSKTAINSVENQARLHPTTNPTTSALSSSSTTSTTTTMTTTETTTETTADPASTTATGNDTAVTTSSIPTPYLVMDISEATYLVIIVPAVMIVNSVFIFIIYYLPLRQLFYRIERYLQAFSKIRNGSLLMAQHAYKKGAHNINLNNRNNNTIIINNNNNNPALPVVISQFPTSSMVDTEGSRSRHRQTEEEIRAAQKRQRRRERKRLARARQLAKSTTTATTTTDPTSTSAASTANQQDPFNTVATTSAVAMCKKSFQDEMIDLGIDEQELKSKSDRLLATVIQLVQLRDMEEHCAAGAKLLERAKSLLEDRAEKIEEIAQLEAKLGVTNNAQQGVSGGGGGSGVNVVTGKGRGQNLHGRLHHDSSPAAGASPNPIDIHMRVV